MVASDHAGGVELGGVGAAGVAVVVRPELPGSGVKSEEGFSVGAGLLVGALAAQSQQSTQQTEPSFLLQPPFAAQRQSHLDVELQAACAAAVEMLYRAKARMPLVRAIAKHG